MTRPAIFTDSTFTDALAAARAQGKLLLVDATASWCGPCQWMDRTTWINRAVVEAIGKSAIAIQLDVDEEPEVSERLRIEAMPTVVAFRDDVELDRVVGLQAPAELLVWLERLVTSSPR
jgi:thioredoxin 1